VPDLDSLYPAVTRNGIGITLAAVLGRLVAEEIATGEPAWLIGCCSGLAASPNAQPGSCATPRTC